MDYEKEYNHAFEIAKGYWGGVTDFVRGILESLFPQLAESDDERIRKVLVDMVKRETGFTGFPSQGQVLAYLEKQKEQNNGMWSEDDEMKVDAMCKEGELKPSEREWLKNLKYRLQKEQKPAEWSEEDESILRLIHEALSCAYSVKNMDAQTCSVIREWLNNRAKSLRPQHMKIDACGFPIREKEETACGYLERCLAPDMRHVWYEACDEIKKAIRLNSWKPSEEQMEALFNNAQLGNLETRVSLESLYNDLKKL